MRSSSIPSHVTPRIWISGLSRLRTLEKVMRAFAKFGVSTFGLDRKDFETEGTQLNVGMPPVAIDFLTTLHGVQFDQAWKNRETTTSDEITIQYLSKADLISAKREAARAVDLADIEELERGE